MNNIPTTHKKILAEIHRKTKVPMDRILFEALMTYHKLKTGNDFKL
jgi:hypothetical protein